VNAGGAGDETDVESGEAEAALQESGRRDGEKTGELGMGTVKDMVRASRDERTRSSVASCDSASACD
jgi:hypothetical protein